MQRVQRAEQQEQLPEQQEQQAQRAVRRVPLVVQAVRLAELALQVGYFAHNMAVAARKEIAVHKGSAVGHKYFVVRMDCTVMVVRSLAVRIVAAVHMVAAAHMVAVAHMVAAVHIVIGRKEVAVQKAGKVGNVAWEEGDGHQREVAFPFLPFLLSLLFLLFLLPFLLLFPHLALVVVEEEEEGQVEAVAPADFRMEVVAVNKVVGRKVAVVGMVERMDP